VDATPLHTLYVGALAYNDFVMWPVTFEDGRESIGLLSSFKNSAFLLE